MNLPAWEAVLPHMPDVFAAANNGIALDPKEREQAHLYQAACRDLMDVLGFGQTALAEVAAQLDDITLADRHKVALIHLLASLGSAAHVLGYMQRCTTDYLALTWPPKDVCSDGVTTQNIESATGVATGEGGQ